MKNLKGFTLVQIMVVVALVAMMAALALPVLAGSVYDRVFVSLGTATGTATYTNDFQYAALKLVRLTVDKNSNATNVVTVTRVITDSSSVNHTNTVGAVTCSSGGGTQATLAYNYLKPGDTLPMSSLIATGGTVIVEFEVQQH